MSYINYIECNLEVIILYMLLPFNFFNYYFKKKVRRADKLKSASSVPPSRFVDFTSGIPPFSFKIS